MATPDTPSDLPAGPNRVDAIATRRALLRMAEAAEAPWLHQESARRMGERLDWIKRQPARVLDWSGPAGASAAVLTSAYPPAQHHLVDELGVAPEQAAARPWWRRWRAGDAPQRRVAASAVQRASADLLWSNMRLHFEPDPPTLIQAWHRALAPDGFLMFSTLGPGTFSSLRAAYRAAGWGEPHAPFVDMHDLGDMLVAAGFADPVMDQETLTLSYADPAALRAELRALGVNSSPQRFAGLRTPRWRATLDTALMRDADRAGQPVLEIELVYGHAFRGPDTGPRVTPEAQIGLDDLKLMLRKPGSRN